MTTAAETVFKPTVGSLVKVRNRDWVVVGSDGPDVLLLRPLTGSSEITGVYQPLEPVEPATFTDPDASQIGDATGIALLFDAARLAIRNGAAPFRLLAHISVDPRPYQFVPLIMALRQDAVRLLIADDVGVGKTIEAAMIARELVDRGRVRRTAVICPAHLTSQWAQELHDKFGLDARVVQPSTIGRLNRELPRPDLSIYQHYPHVVVSIDWIKSEANKPQFLRDAPDLVIIDEAHMCAKPPGQTGKSQQQRYTFVSELATKSPNLVLVSATPHSGVEESFRSLVGLLDPELDTTAPALGFGVISDDDSFRNQLKKNIVLRRRNDLAHWLDAKTDFPERLLESQDFYPSERYLSLYDDVVAYCRESIRQGAGLNQRQQRVRFWAATAILRCVLSSPEAARSVLEKRADKQNFEQPADLDSGEEADELYESQVLDMAEDSEATDVAPTAPIEDADVHLTNPERQRLLALGRRAADLAGAKGDVKLAELSRILTTLLKAGSSPIVFCRYIATANYVEQQLPALLAAARLGSTNVKAVTGELGDEARRHQVEQLSHSPSRVLVATDCLSEGINLQEHFDAVIHYDLPWNPNRLEQRDGRVDRFGQPKAKVHSIRLVGRGTTIDEIVNSKLLEKSIAIRNQLGVTVPVPGEVSNIAEAIVNSVLLAGPSSGAQSSLGLEDPALERLNQELDRAVERERAIQGYFSTPIQPDEVQTEIAVSEAVLGDSSAIHRFVDEGVRRFNGSLTPAHQRQNVYKLQVGELAPALAERGGTAEQSITFEAVLGAEGVAAFAGRTHPAVELLAETVLGRALAPEGDEAFPRCGALYTRAVDRRLAVALLRVRYRLSDVSDEYAEEVVLACVEETASGISASSDGVADLLQRAQPAANMSLEEKRRRVEWALNLMRENPGWHAGIVYDRKAELQAANNRLRETLASHPLTIEAYPPDLLGLCVLVPSAV